MYTKDLGLDAFTAYNFLEFAQRRSLSMLAIREFSTLFHGQSLLMMEVALWHVFSRLVAQR